jgi:MoaA/NifB/PqqE/SkfB family radical SAM enzyme
MITTITSNGMLLTARRWAPLAPFVDVVAISIDGTPPEHDRIRGHPGAFARTVTNLEVLRSSGVPFGLIFTPVFYVLVRSIGTLKQGSTK